MSHLATQIASPPDREVMKALLRLAKQFDGRGSITLNIQIGTNDPLTESGPIAEMRSSALVERLSKSRSSIISRAILTTKPYSVDFNRQVSQTTLTINFPQSGDHDATVEFVEAAKAAFVQFDPIGGISSVLGPELAEFYRRREEAVLRLEGMTEALVTRTEEYRQELDRRHDDKSSQLEERTNEIERNLEQTYSQKQAELEQQRQALEARAKELDDRSSRHARRDLRNQLKQILKERNERFRLTEDTQRKRWPVHGMFLLLLIVAGTYTFDVVRDALASQGTIGWPALIRTALALASFGGTAAFYIRWNDSWARKHAEEEFRLRQLEIDVDRASWVVEMALEWKDEEGVQSRTGWSIA